MNPLRLTMDGRTYRVLIVEDTYRDTFTLIEGPNAGDMLNDRHERDLIGTSDTFEMFVMPDPRYPAEFTEFYNALRAPVVSHTVTVIDGQSYLTYEAMIQSGTRTLTGTRSGNRIYSGMTVKFVPVEPQWEVSE